jgi:hypothetical protein
MRATRVVHEKFAYADGAIVEIKAWQVPKTALRPEGYKYSMAYIDTAGQRVLGYDNAHQKGHHRHYHQHQTPVEFNSLDGLIQQFLAEVKKIRGEES